MSGVWCWGCGVGTDGVKRLVRGDPNQGDGDVECARHHNLFASPASLSRTRVQREGLEQSGFGSSARVESCRLPGHEGLGFEV